jgi:hypothetical protein
VGLVDAVEYDRGTIEVIGSLRDRCLYIYVHVWGAVCKMPFTFIAREHEVRLWETRKMPHPHEIVGHQ